MNKKISEKKVNFSTENEPVNQKVRQNVSKTCQNVIDLLRSKKNDPNFVDKCQQIFEIFEEQNGQRK